MATKYEVWSIKNGKIDKMIYVMAENKEDACQKAVLKFKEMKLVFHGVKIAN